MLNAYPHIKPSYLRKASGSEATEGLESSTTGSGTDLSPYAFKTLWQEITKGIQAGTQALTNISVTRLNESGETARHYWDTTGSRADSMDRNLGFYILLGGVLVVAIVALIVNNKKSK